MASGGAEKVVLTLIEQFHKYEENLELVCIERQQTYEIPDHTSQHYLTNYDDLQNAVLKFPSIIWCAARLKKRIRNQKVAVVQSHLFRASFINVIAKMMGANHHAQIIVHSRINFDHQPKLVQAFSKWVYRQIFKRADSIVSICQVMKNEMDQYLGIADHQNHRVIYNPHSLSKIEALTTEEPSCFVFSPTKKYLVAVGRMVELKRYQDIIQALSIVRKDFKNVELIFVGDGVEKASLMQEAKTNHLEAYVHFLGYQSNPYTYLAKADIMVLSSRTEGLPNAIIESLACGTPVVASDCISGPREILNPKSDLSIRLENGVEEGDFGLLYPVGKVEDLAKAITIFLHDDEKFNTYQEKALKRANDFDAERIGKMYLNSFPNGK